MLFVKRVNNESGFHTLTCVSFYEQIASTNC